MNKKFLLGTILFLLFFSSVAYAQNCETAIVKSALKKALFDYFKDPSNSKLPVEQIRDLLTFYLGIGVNEITVNCAVQGGETGIDMKSIVDQAKSIISQVPSCSDNTTYGECSVNKPEYCFDGNLINKCSICGCDNNASCSNDKCIVESPKEGIICNTDLDCGTSGYTSKKYCARYINNPGPDQWDVIRNLQNFTCLNPGTTNSSCYSFTKGVKIEDCTSQGKICIEGVCVGVGELVCSDEDATEEYPDGINYYKKSLITRNYSSVYGYDRCLGDILSEAYCDEFGILSYKEYDCTSEGKRCGDNRCVGVGELACDQTDVTSEYPNGLNYYEKGFGDSCGQYDEILTEAYCDEFGFTVLERYDCSIEEKQCGFGECIGIGEGTCIESDGGKNHYEQGWISLATISGYFPTGSPIFTGPSMEDSCYGPNHTLLKEFYCNEYLNIDSYLYDCASEGKICVEGICVDKGSGLCQDSDKNSEYPNGINYYERGTTSLGSSTAGDYCSHFDYYYPNDNIYRSPVPILVESYCNEFEDIIRKRYDCWNEGKTCVDGACREATCTDSDGGENYYEFGTAVIKTSDGSLDLTRKDSCISSFGYGVGHNITLREQFCAHGYIVFSDYSCADERKVCDRSLGKCVDPPAGVTCIDSDGGLNYNLHGKVTLGESELQDYCHPRNGTVINGRGALIEGYCNDGFIDTREYNCPNGCLNGACLR